MTGRGVTGKGELPDANPGCGGGVTSVKPGAKGLWCDVDSRENVRWSSLNDCVDLLTGEGRGMGPGAHCPELNDRRSTVNRWKAAWPVFAPSCDGMEKLILGRGMSEGGRAAPEPRVGRPDVVSRVMVPSDSPRVLTCLHEPSGYSVRVMVLPSLSP